MHLPKLLLQNDIGRLTRITWRLRFILFSTGLIFSTYLIAANESPSVKDKAAELESVRSQIKDVEFNIQAAQAEIDKIQQELRANEIAAGEIGLKLKKIQWQAAKKQIRLSELSKAKARHDGKLVIERKKLAKQIRAAYMTGKGDYLKLLLNQEDSALVGRVLAYYDYHNRARTRQINTITEMIDAIAQIQISIQLENDALAQLKTEQLSKRNAIESSRKTRSKIISRLEERISEQGLQLQSLYQHEKELSDLLAKLGKAEDSIIFFEDIPPFSSLKGKLNWPTQGKLLNRFSSNRKGGALKWQGVKISAWPGSDVRAISTGKVVFADWFRNMGLLMIIDHGEGYMSLYGYNQSLLKKPGDWVVDDEVIAYAGDSGGQSESSVYFEIRHRGEPLNPVLWCKK